MRISKTFDDKARFKRYRRRVGELPAPWEETARALERYLFVFGPSHSDYLLPMVEDLVDLLETAVSDGTPLRAVVGEDPIEFVEAFLRSYPESEWIHKERERVVRAVDRAAAATSGSAGDEHGREDR